ANGDDRVLSAFYFDDYGERSTVHYSPDVDTLNRVMAAEWEPAGIRYRASVHSHPRGVAARPSGGDLSYARDILDAVPELGELVVFIAHSGHDHDAFALCPYTIERGPDGRLRATPATLQIVPDQAPEPTA